MKFVKVMLGSLMLAFAPLAALADDMSYSYVEIGYVETDLDGGPTADGFSVRGSVGFGENFFVFADYTDQDLQGIDIDQIAVGLGGHLDLTEQLDLVGRVGYVEGEASFGPFAVDVNGYLVSAGLRGQVTDQFELEGHAVHVDLGDDGDDTVFVVGGRYHINELVSVGAEFGFGDDANSIFAGVRFSF